MSAVHLLTSIVESGQHEDSEAVSGVEKGREIGEERNGVHAVDDARIRLFLRPGKGRHIS